MERRMNTIIRMDEKEPGKNITICLGRTMQGRKQREERTFKQVRRSKTNGKEKIGNEKGESPP